MHRSIWYGAIATLGLVGCAGDVKTTEDSTKVEVEVPKVEVKGTPDLDPRTDHDVDIDTPLRGDK